MLARKSHLERVSRWLARQDKELQVRFSKVARQLAENEAKIVAELKAAQGRPVGGLLALESALAERIVFSKIRDSIGGRLRCLASGSAPLPLGVAEFFAGLGLTITEGYGLTETSPIVAANTLTSPRLGTVGRPIPGVEAPQSYHQRSGQVVIPRNVDWWDATRELREKFEVEAVKVEA